MNTTEIEMLSCLANGGWLVSGKRSRKLARHILAESRVIHLLARGGLPYLVMDGAIYLGPGGYPYEIKRGGSDLLKD